MMLNKLHRWLTFPLRAARLVTLSRLARLCYYVRTNQPSIILDRVKRLLELGRAAPMQLFIYSPSDISGPIVFADCEYPLVSIIIPVYNHWETTRTCLYSIHKNTPAIAYEVIVADDCSTDDTNRLSELAPGTHHIKNSENLGFLRNCNKAAKHARGKYVLLLNNDTQVQPNWLSPLVELVEKQQNVGMVGAMLLYPNGRLQEAGGIIWQDGSGWNYGHYDYPERPEYNYLKEVDYVSGASILIRKALWDEIGGFDERFVPAYYEDTDLAFEVRNRGYRVMFQPLSRVVHFEGVSHGTDMSSGIKSHQAVNKEIFQKKWASVLKAQHGRDPRDIFRARDRSMQKKHLLFIDHYVPLRDQDAGSKSTFQYLALMAEMGYQITFLGDNFVDYQPYTNELQQMGIEVLYGPGLQRHWKRWIRAYGNAFDYVYFSRPHITKKYLPHIKRHSSAKLLYCGHDLHFLREERHYHLEGKRAHLQASRKWLRDEEDILRQVDIGYFFSTFEVEEARKKFSGVTVQAMPLYLYEEELEPSHVGFNERKGLLFVGGFMHAPNTDAVLWFVRNVFPLILKQVPDLELTIVGSHPPTEITQLANNHIRIVGRVSEEKLRQAYDQNRVVVAPLRFGAGVKGKIIEAMRYSVPTVTTTIGAEGIADAAQALLIADEAVDFANAVVFAYTSQEAWENFSRFALLTVQKHYSKESARLILEQGMPL